MPDRQLPTGLELARFKARLRRRLANAKATRQAAGLTAADVARSLGVKRSALVGWENGKHEPRELAVAVAWVELLDQLDELVAEERAADVGEPELPPTGTEGGEP